MLRLHSFSYLLHYYFPALALRAKRPLSIIFPSFDILVAFFSVVSGYLIDYLMICMITCATYLMYVNYSLRYGTVYRVILSIIVCTGE